MFATLASGYPRPDLPAGTSGDDLVSAVIDELAEAGLEILSDGGVRRDDPIGGIAARLQGFEIGDAVPYLDTGRTYRRPRAIHEPRWDGPIFVREWQAAAQATDRPVKQALVGPYTLGRLADPGPLSRERLTMALADALGHEVRALIAAGVPIVQIDEDAAPLVGDNPVEQQLFKAAQRRLTHGTGDAHLTLAVTGGGIVGVPPQIFFDAPYRSYLVDLVTDPRHWAVVRGAPAERGIIVGVADARTEAPDDPEFLAWAALSAAALAGRGPDRIGLAPSGSLAALSRDAALAKVRMLAEVAADTHARAANDPAALDGRRLAEEGRARGWLVGGHEQATTAG
jgi:methionine synthase II (cobalamin-independent)